MTDREPLLRALKDAVRDSPVRTVQVETPDGRELLFYAPEGDGRHVGGGTMIIPADTPENRRRARLTRGCPVCPDVNQGLMSREFEGDGGSYVIAVYATCGHEVMGRLDSDGEPVVVNPPGE
jgi:hypothetical protein